MLARPERFFEDRFGLTSSTMERLLGSALAGRVDHADLYLEYRVSEELTLEEGAVKKAARHVSQGAGVRAQSGERTGYAHTDDLSLPNIEEAARQARSIADQASASGVVAVSPHGAPHDLYTLSEPPIAADLDRKVKLLGEVDALARSLDPRVRQVITNVGSENVVVLIATPSGWTVGDVRPLTRLNVTVIVEDNGKREIGSYGGGGRVAFDFFFEGERWQRLHQGGGAAGSDEAGRGGGAGRLPHRRARAGLAGHPAARGDRPRTRGGFQSQADVGVLRASSARRSPPNWSPSWTTAPSPNRRGSLNVDDEGVPTVAQCPDRERDSARLHAGSAQRPPDGHARPPATGAESRMRIRLCLA